MAEFWTPRVDRSSGLVRPVRIDPRGIDGPSTAQARGRAWRRTSHGWYVPSSTNGECVEQRILEQSVRLPEGGAVTAWAALRWMGGHFFTGVQHGRRLPVPVVLGGWRDLGRDDLISVSRERFWWDELVVVDGVACATPERALFDEVRRSRDVRGAAVAAEMAFAAGISSPERFAAYVGTRPGWTGVPHARAVVPLLCTGARSP